MDLEIRKHRLVTVEGEDRKTYPLEHQVHIGRVQDNDIVIAHDQKVSRYHAMVTVGPNGVSITDLNSSNGTYVNNYLITTSAALNPGDRINIGDTNFVMLGPMQTSDDLATRVTRTFSRPTSSDTSPPVSSDETLFVSPGTKKLKKPPASQSKLPIQIPKFSSLSDIPREAIIGLGIAALIALVIVAVIFAFVVGRISPV